MLTAMTMTVMKTMMMRMIIIIIHRVIELNSGERLSNLQETEES